MTPEQAAVLASADILMATAVANFVLAFEVTGVSRDAAQVAVATVLADLATALVKQADAAPVKPQGDAN